jgi:dethiobiotin synthetase
MNGFFVTGTDTGVGKSQVAAALLHLYAEQGLRGVGMKPVAAGHAPGAINEDVALLRAASNVEAPLEWINPYSLELPIAPHVAADQAGITIDIERIIDCQQQLARLADVLIVEGAGGFLVPLNEREALADLAVRMQLPIILVVGMRLGCLNHALLTVEAIQRRGLALAGWVANRLDPAMAVFDANLSTLSSKIPAPLLGVIPSLIPSANPIAAKGFVSAPSLDNSIRS